MKILLVEDEKISRITLTNTLRKEGYEVTSCEDGGCGLAEVEHNRFDVVLTDLRLPKATGIEILTAAKKKDPSCPVIIMTAYASVDTAVEALQQGAFDYLTKPFSPEKLLARLRHIRKLKEVLEENTTLKKRLLGFEKRVLIGNSPAIQKLVEMITLVAPGETTVLIEGESGTGKELVARALHSGSHRAESPFVAVNSGVIPENLFESAIFGHEKGSFSGAHARHIGYFERANGGTIFIDDIDDFPYQLQVKLLRVLQEREIERVGGTEPIPVDTRVLAASKANLWEMVQKKRFREDLYFRLNIVPIHVPALRDRKGDIPLLVEHFMVKHGAEAKAQARLSELMRELMEYDWPGNVRQLENIVQRVIALPEIAQLGLSGTEQVAAPPPPAAAGTAVAKPYPPYARFIEQKDREIILWALGQARFNTSNAARILEIPRSTLRSKMEKYAIGHGESMSALG